MNTRIEVLSLGERIATLRKEQNMTQAQLADKINVSNKTISRWETGEGYPEITLLLPLAEALGVTVDFLLGGENNRSNLHDDNAPKRTAKKHREIPTGKCIFTREYLCNRDRLTNLLVFLYLLIFGFVALESFTYSTYLYDGASALTHSSALGQFYTSRVIYVMLCAAIIFLFALLWWSRLLVKNRAFDKYYGIRNLIFFSVYNALFFIIACNKPVLGRIADLTSHLLPYTNARGTFLSCDFFQVSRETIGWFVIIALALFLVTEFIGLVFDYLKYRQRMKNGEHEQSYFASLTIFNKIAFICLCITIITVVIILGYLLISQLTFLKPSLTTFMPITILNAFLVLRVPAIGLLSGLIGLVAGLFDLYDRQTKTSVKLAVACGLLLCFPIVMLLPPLVIS